MFKKKITRENLTRALSINSGYYQEIRDYRDDCEKIVSAVKEKLEIDMTVVEAAIFWNWRSRRYDATWLGIGNDNEIVEWVKKYIDRVAESDEDYFVD